MNLMELCVVLCIVKGNVLFTRQQNICLKQPTVCSLEAMIVLLFLFVLFWGNESSDFDVTPRRDVIDVVVTRMRLCLCLWW
jgi:hypothetical protein